jgi:hypothetical protein
MTLQLIEPTMKRNEHELAGQTKDDRNGVFN